MQAVGAPTEVVREQDKLMLVLSYLGIFALIPLFMVKDSDFVKWHAKNGLLWGLGGSIVLSVVTSILGAIPYIGWVFTIVGCAAWVGWLAVDILAMVKALNGERWRIPFATDIAEKL